jgi:ABC-type polysaccharide/polyol phosphate export permease
MNILAYFKPFGIDFFCVGRKFLVLNLVSRNLKIKYRRSFLGVFWTLLSPLASTGIFYFVFKIVMKVQVPHYLAFILSGLLPWTFFNQSLMEGLDSIAGSVGLISKVPVPIQVFPLVGTVTNLVTLILALPILIGTAWLSSVSLGPSLIMLAYFFFTFFLMTYSLSLILGIFFVYFRDLKHLMSLVTQLWLYATPVFYDAKMLPPKFAWLPYANPVGTTFIAFHRILSQGEWCTQTEVWVTAAWTTAFLALGLGVYKLFAQDVAENL